MERRDRIATLLDFYDDVRQGFNDPPNGGGDGVSLFSGTWSGPAYTQLRERLLELGLASPTAYLHLTGYYFGVTWTRRSRCPRCRHVFPPSSLARIQHCDGREHGQRRGSAVTLEPYMQRGVPEYVNRKLVSLSLDWLDAHWIGLCDLPKEIRECILTREKVALLRGKPLALA